jgi:hypothetical protein
MIWLTLLMAASLSGGVGGILWVVYAAAGA